MALQGSYIVNEGVKGSAPPSHRNKFKESKKRCQCLIATVFVFTVAAIVVLLAMNSKSGGKDQRITGNPSKFNHFHGKIQTAEISTTTTTERITIHQEVKRPSSGRKGHGWFDDGEPEDEEIDKYLGRIKETKSTSPTMTTSPTRTVQRIFISDRFPGTPPRPIAYQSSTEVPKKYFLEITEETPRKVGKTNSNELEDLPPNFEDENKGPRKDLVQYQDFYHQEPNQPEQRTNERIYFPGDDLWKSATENPSRFGIFPSTTTTRETTVPTTLRPTTISPLAFEKKRILIEPPECPKICESSKCKKSLAGALMKMDFDQDPCEDFYRYACNGQVLNQINPTSLEDSFLVQIKKFLEKDPREEPFVQKFKTFQESCLNFDPDNIDTVKDYLNKYFQDVINTVAPLEGLEDSKSHNLTHFIGRILIDGHLGSPLIPLFDIGLESIEDHGEVPVITIPKDYLIEERKNPNEEKCKEIAKKMSEAERSSSLIFKSYHDCLNELNYKLVDNLTSSEAVQVLSTDYDSERVGKLRSELQSFIHRLTKVEILQELSSSDGILMTIEELSTQCPAIEWKVLFPILFDDHVEQVKVRFNDRLNSLCEFYKNHDFDVLRDVITTMVANSWTEELLQLPKENKNVACQRMSMKLMQDVVSNVYMSQVQLEPLRSFEKSAKDILNQLKQNLIAHLEMVPWLSTEEKGDVIAQVDRVEIFDNYPSVLKRDENVVSNMVLYMSLTDFVKNVQVLQRRTRTLFRNFKRLSDATVFPNLFNPLATEVQFIEGRNLIWFPLPLVHSLISRGELNALQEYEVYAQLGYLIGRALVRPLELRKLKKFLKSEENEDLQDFEYYLVSENPIRSFKGIDLQLDLGSTNISMNSRFADDFSLRSTWETYEKFSFTDLPIFTEKDSIPKTYFLLVAQQFCEAPPRLIQELVVDLYSAKDLPHHLRVNNMIMNSGKFKDTFSCPVGSAMSPLMKNRQFPFIDEAIFHQ